MVPAGELYRAPGGPPGPCLVRPAGRRYIRAPRRIRPLSIRNLRQVKARVHVTLKPGILDPQGKAIQHALGALGFGAVDKVRQGKVIDLEIAETDPEAARARLTEMCEKLLANTVIENYAIELDAGPEESTTP